MVVAGLVAPDLQAHVRAIFMTGWHSMQKITKNDPQNGPFYSNYYLSYHYATVTRACHGP